MNFVIGGRQIIIIIAVILEEFANYWGEGEGASAPYNQVHQLSRLLRNIWKKLTEMLRAKAPILM